MKLAGPDEQSLVRKGTDNSEAYQLCLKGRYHWARRNRWHLRAAIECFEKAVAIDPGYALAHAGVADCYTVMTIYGVRPGVEIGPLAERAAERAIALDPMLAEAQHSLAAMQQWVKYDFAAAEAGYHRALELNPSLAITHAYLALFYAIRRRSEESRAAALRAVALEPDAAVINYIAGGGMYWNRDAEAGERFTRHALELEPDAAFPHWVWSLNQWARGLVDDAVTSAEHAVLIGDRQPVLISILGFLYGRVGREPEAEEILAEARRRGEHEYFAPFWLGSIYLGLRRYNEGFDCLERGFDEGNGWVQSINCDPMYEELRGNPRFHALLRRMNLA